MTSLAALAQNSDGSLNGRLQLVAIALTLLLFVLVFEMVRRRKLMERYSLLWLFASMVLLALAVFTDLLAEISELVGIATPSNALFAAGIGFMVVLLLHFSATISRLTDETKILAQRLALAEERLAGSERRSISGSSDESDRP